MSTRDYTKHLVSSTPPTNTKVGDEYYDPITNKLYKKLAVNGTTVTDVEIAQENTLTIIQGVDDTQNTTITAINSYAQTIGTTANGANGLAAGAFAAANTKVASITGTANQITANVSAPNVLLSLPQSIATGSSVQFGSFGVGTAASGTAGEIRATNNITAFFSDKRLKNIITTIPNALSKVLTLSGVLYTQNKFAEQFGYKDYQQQVGLIAQEVQVVQPEAVKIAPFDMDKEGNSKSGENYLTVQYEKLIPLLVEAIKEQQNTIESQEERLKKLETLLK
jgi:hypothetical protein